MSPKDENENDKTLKTSNDDDKNENEDETMSQNKKNKRFKWSFRWNNWQIKIKKLEGLKGFRPYKDFGDKELKFKYFKIELADMSNEIDKKLFEQIFGHTLIKLADKLINTTNKEENQIIVKNIEKKIKKHFLKWRVVMIGWSNQTVNILI